MTAEEPDISLFQTGHTHRHLWVIPGSGVPHLCCLEVCRSSRSCASFPPLCCIRCDAAEKVTGFSVQLVSFRVYQHAPAASFALLRLRVFVETPCAEAFSCPVEGGDTAPRV